MVRQADILQNCFKTDNVGVDRTSVAVTYPVSFPCWRTKGVGPRKGA